MVNIGGLERIKMTAPHHKTESSRSAEISAPITFTFPLCDLNTLLIWWMNKGWQLVRFGKQDPSPMVFASGHLKTFNCYTLVGWWDQFKSKHCPKNLKPGTITELRSVFIEAYTEKIPDDEVKWHKAALVMGNSVSTWKKYYAIHLKKRKMQDSIDSFASDFLDCNDDEVEESALLSSHGVPLPPMELPASSSSRSSRNPLIKFTSEGHDLVASMDGLSMSEITGDELGSW